MYCVECLKQYILELVGQKKAVDIVCPIRECGAELKTEDVQALLSSPEFDHYLEATFMAFIEQDSVSFVCPNDKCNLVISVDVREVEEVPRNITLKDPDGNPLTPDTWRHFQEYRKSSPTIADTLVLVFWSINQPDTADFVGKCLGKRWWVRVQMMCAITMNAWRRRGTAVGRCWRVDARVVGSRMNQSVYPA